MAQQTTMTATITTGTALSAGVALGNKQIVGIAMSATWDAAALTFQVSVDGGATWLEMQGASAVISYTAAASQYVAVDPALWRGVNMVKVRSGTSGSPVNQSTGGTDRVLTLVTVPIQ